MKARKTEIISSSLPNNPVKLDGRTGARRKGKSIYIAKSYNYFHGQKYFRELPFSLYGLWFRCFPPFFIATVGR